MKTIAISVLLSLSSMVLFGQDFFDALRFSQTQYGGSARSISMGSAFGALGGDFISASINPAGLGIYRSGEISFSPTLNINNIEADFLGKKYSDNKYNFNFNNISYVSNLKTGVETGIVNITLGFGYNRLKNFHSNYRMQTSGAKATLLNYYTDYANSIGNPDKFDYHYEGLAWNTWLIDEDPDMSVLEGIYYNEIADYNVYDIQDQNGTIIGKGYELSGVKPHFQRKIVSTSGKIDEYLFSAAANINHKVFIGGSIGLLDLQYRKNEIFTETDDQNMASYFDSYSQTTEKLVDGMGLNFKVGVIYRPFKSLRLGASVHTPTFYSLSHDQTKTIDAYYNKPVGNENNQKTTWTDKNNQYFEYELETPFKAVFSVAWQLGSFAMISVDYDYINYRSMKFRHSGDNYDYTDKNNEIQDYMNSTGDLRIGGEFRVTPNLSLRAGYGLFGNGWNNSTKINEVEVQIKNSEDTFSSYSCGLGYRQKNFFVDLAYRMTTTNESYKVFEMSLNNIEPAGANLATLKGMNNQATLTFGFRF